MRPVTVYFYWVGVDESFLCRDMPCLPNVGERLMFDRDRPEGPLPEGVVIRREWRIGWGVEIEVEVTVDRRTP